MEMMKEMMLMVVIEGVMEVVERVKGMMMVMEGEMEVMEEVKGMMVVVVMNATTNSRPSSDESQYLGVPLGRLLSSEAAEVAGDSDTG